MCEDNNYKGNMLRGLISPDWIVDGVVVVAAFSFQNTGRSDGYSEMSITWYENEEALETIMKQTRTDGEIQFKGGIAELDRTRLKTFLMPYILEGRLNYEKRPTQDNKYHGNLLLRNGTHKSIAKLITAGLALVAGKNIRANKYCTKQT